MTYYATDNLSLCPYLDLNGLRFVKAEISFGRYDKPVVSFIFEDELGVGKDLERAFIRSTEKKYRDLLLFYRKEIEKLKRQVERTQLEDDKKKDDKYYAEFVKKEGTNE